MLPVCRLEDGSTALRVAAGDFQAVRAALPGRALSAKTATLKMRDACETPVARGVSGGNSRTVISRQCGATAQPHEFSSGPDPELCDCQFAGSA